MQINDGIQKDFEEVDSFLMIGQSNMAGRGDVTDVEPIHNPLCFMLRNGRWQKMREPINPDRPIFEGKYRSGVGLAASFADEYANEHGVRTGLIPCADGGTKLCQWMPGEVLYDHAVMQVKLAQRSSRIRGILWHQGESDCGGNGENLLTYKENFIAMMTALRCDLGDETLPVIIGELSEYITPEHGRGENPAKLNKVFAEIARELPNCAVVSSKDLPLKPDGLHFSAVACREFGKRYYRAYRALCEKN